MLGAIDSKPCLFYINYGWRGLIFCFQKRLQSKIFQARFRAFKVLLLRSFLYKQFSTIKFGNFFVVLKKIFMKWYLTIRTLDHHKNTALSRFWKFRPNVWPDFEGNILFLYSENWKKVEKFAKPAACLISNFSMRKSLYSLESPLIFK
jgi:hypothetical protein